jgi:hypothetical protein
MGHGHYRLKGPSSETLEGPRGDRRGSTGLHQGRVLGHCSSTPSRDRRSERAGSTKQKPPHGPACEYQVPRRFDSMRLKICDASCKGQEERWQRGRSLASHPEVAGTHHTHICAHIVEVARATGEEESANTRGHWTDGWERQTSEARGEKKRGRVSARLYSSAQVYGVFEVEI